MPSNPMRDLLAAAASGGRIDPADVTALPRPTGEGASTFHSRVREVVAECQALAADGATGPARAAAFEATRTYGAHLDNWQPPRPDVDGLSPAELAALVTNR